MNFSKYNQNNLLYSSFNQNNDCVVFGTTNGFYVYSLYPFKKIISRNIEGGISIVKMLYKSNILVFVGNTKHGLYPNNKIIIWDDSQKQVIGEISFKNQVKNVCLSKGNIVVILDKKIFIYNFKDLSMIQSIETFNNPNGLCHIIDENIIVYPSFHIGNITIYNYTLDKHVIDIEAHKNEIELFTIDTSNTYIASSSIKGTIIRIYNIKYGTLIKELRRGSNYIKIVDLKFSFNLKYLLCSSEKGTIHIYNIKLDENTELNTNYLSYFLPEYFNSEWSIIKFYMNTLSYSIFMKEDNQSNIDTNTNKIISIGNNGCIYNLSIDVKNHVGNIDTRYKFILNNENPFEKTN